MAAQLPIMGQVDAYCSSFGTALCVIEKYPTARREFHWQINFYALTPFAHRGSTYTVFHCVKNSRAALPCSRVPLEESLKPPKGTWGSAPAVMELMWTS